MGPYREFRPKAVIGGLFLFFVFALAGHASAQTWTLTGNLNTARASHAMFLLSDGRVLAAGELNTGGPVTNTAELWDPATGIWTFTGSTTLVHTDSTAVRLQDGRVLITGGRFGSTSLSTAEIYNPATGTWSVTGSMNQARVLHTATLLPNGKVLVTGGFDLSGGFLNSAEIYNPATGTWSFAASLPVGAWQQTATVLPNGTVLVAGGENYAFCPPCSISSAFIYNPATNIWSTTGSLNAPRAAHRASLLSNGKVLVAGGAINADGHQALNTAELYDPASGTWSFTGMLNAARNSHTMTVLADGKVLVAGGFSASGSLQSAERYNPTTGSWTVVGNLNQGRQGHAAALLADGRVLVSGGSNASGSLASAELFGGIVTISPGTGNRWASTQAMDLTLIVETAPGVVVTGGSATFDGADVTGPLAACIDGHVGTLAPPLTGMTFRCPGLVGASFTRGSHTFSVTLNLSNGTTVSATATWQVVANSEP